MEIKLAKTAGFCWGVKRAIDITLEAARGESEPVYTFGPLIHNPQLIELLESKNIHTISDIKELDSDSVIIRTHGITPEKRMEIKSTGLSINDATCPLVAKVQGLIKKYSGKGYSIVIVGDEGHAEVIGLKGFAKTDVYIIAKPEDALKLPDLKQVFVAAQTTCDQEKYEKAIEILKDRYPDLQVGDTICDATIDRQDEVIRLASEVEAMIVVGGSNSANTARLTSIAREKGVKAIQVETGEDLDLKMLNGYQKIGVTAGASTPKWVIDDVIEKLRTGSDVMARLPYLLDKGINILAKSNLFLALGAAALAFANIVLLKGVTTTPLLAVPFFAVLSTYLLSQLLRTDDSRKSLSRRGRYHKEGKIVFWALGLGSLSAGFYFSWQLGYTAFLLYSSVVIFGTNYEMPFAPLKKTLSIVKLKDIPASKELFVAFAWGIITALIPFIYSPHSILIVLTFLYAFTFAYIRTAILGLRYIREDEIVGREAIQIVLGKEKASRLLYGFVVTMIIMLLTGYFAGTVGWEIFGFLAGSVYLLGLVYYSFTQEKGKTRLFELFFDLQLLITGVLVYLLSSL
ncbi:MAG: 4-hydroxy-3-methylbut-2-enyl diphosphate reductase [Nitrospinota bacterium]